MYFKKSLLDLNWNKRRRNDRAAKKVIKPIKKILKIEIVDLSAIKKMGSVKKSEMKKEAIFYAEEKSITLILQKMQKTELKITNLGTKFIMIFNQ